VANVNFVMRQPVVAGAFVDEFLRFDWNRDRPHDQRPGSDGRNEKSQLIAGFLFVPIPQNPRSCFTQPPN
jgi:hypothetical protein